MECPKCGGVLPPQTEGSARFCIHCGASLDEPFASQRPVLCLCGASLPASARFCPSCGRARPAPEASPSGFSVSPDMQQSPGSGTNPADVLISCPKCSAKVRVTQESCPSCGTKIDPMVRFKELMTACRAKKMPIQDVRRLMEQTGLTRPTRRFGCMAILLVLGFVWLMGTTAFGAGAPGTLAWTAPLLCPAGYQGTVVPISVSSFQGKTSMTADLYCIDKEGFAVEVSGFKAYPLVGLYFAAGALALILLLKTLAKLRAALRPVSPNDARRIR